MFEAILNILLYKEMHSSSEEILVKLTRDMKAEFHIDFNESDSIPAAFTEAFEIISSIFFKRLVTNAVISIDAALSKLVDDYSSDDDDVVEDEESNLAREQDRVIRI